MNDALVTEHHPLRSQRKDPNYTEHYAFNSRRQAISCARRSHIRPPKGRRAHQWRHNDATTRRRLIVPSAPRAVTNVTGDGLGRHDGWWERQTVVAGGDCARFFCRANAHNWNRRLVSGNASSLARRECLEVTAAGGMAGQTRFAPPRFDHRSASSVNFRSDLHSSSSAAVSNDTSLGLD